VHEVGSAVRRIGSSLSLLVLGVAVGFLAGLLRRRPPRPRVTSTPATSTPAADGH
jgi:hypothetical protein